MLAVHRVPITKPEEISSFTEQEVIEANRRHDSIHGWSGANTRLYSKLDKTFYVPGIPGFNKETSHADIWEWHRNMDRAAEVLRGV